LEHLFFDLFGGEDAWHQRASLIARTAGNPSAWVDVVLFDLEFPTDWWNSEPNASALDADLQRAHVGLAGQSALFETVESVVRWKRGEATNADVCGVARRDFGANVLPPSSALALYILAARIDAREITPVEALRVYGPTLTRRSQTGDLDAFRAIASLNQMADTPRSRAELSRIDHEVCTQRRIPRFCGSLLLDALHSHSAVDPVLAEVRQAVPDDPGVATWDLFLALGGTGASLEPHLVDYLLRRPRYMPNSYGWKFAFLALAALRRDHTLSAEGRYDASHRARRRVGLRVDL
jgi:hypothetical protein